METGVTFQSAFFAPLPGEDHETNPGRYGRALALWLAAELRAEDFGWTVVISRQPFLLWLGCGNVDGSADTWRVFPVAEPSLAQRIFRRPNTTVAVGALWQRVRELVPRIPGVGNILWE